MAATTPACTTAFRFATWNVLYGRARAPAVGGSLHECPAEAQVAAQIGTDVAIEHRYRRIAQTVSVMQLDWLMLQELDEQLLQMIEKSTDFNTVCYDKEAQVGLLQHAQCASQVVSTHHSCVATRGVVAVQLHLSCGRRLQLCALHVTGAVRKGGIQAIRAMVSEAKGLHDEAGCSCIFGADWNMELRDEAIQQAWTDAGGSVHHPDQFTVGRSNNQLDCFDGFVSFGLPQDSAIVAIPIVQGLMPKYLGVTEAKDHGESVLRYNEDANTTIDGQIVDKGELLVWNNQTEACSYPEQLIPDSAVLKGLSDHLMVVGELRFTQ